MQETTQNSTTPKFKSTVLADAVFRPMLFSTLMVKALLDGSKTQTRRILKDNVPLGNWNETLSKSPVKVGDIIWVRETHTYHRNYWHYRADTGSAGEELRQEYIKSGCESAKWKPSLFMPKEACRLFLKVTDVRVERLNDISEIDAISEGVENCRFSPSNFVCYTNKDPSVWCSNAQRSYRSLWQKINGNDSWEQNPLVWVYIFERVECHSGFR